MRRHIYLFGALAAGLTTLVAGCGGGGGGEILGGTTVIPGQTVQIVSPPPETVIARGGAVFSLSAEAASATKSLSTMKWTVTSTTPGAPLMTLTNPNCDATAKSDLGGSISSSTWACKTSTVAPASTKDATYQILITATDSAGASASHTSVVQVSAVPSADVAALQPVVVTTPAVTVLSGSNAGLTCMGSPGASAISGPMTYAWSLKLNPDGLGLALTDADKQTVQFAVPVVATGRPKHATFTCTVTDISGNSASADVAVTIATDADSVPLPTVTGSSTKVQLYTGQESQLSCQGTGGYIASTGGTLHYQWVVKTNESGMILDLTGSDQSTVRVKPGDFPASVTDPKVQVVLQCRVTDDANRTTTIDIPAEVNKYTASAAGNTVIADAGLSRNVSIGDIVVLDGSGSKVAGGAAVQLYYSWTQVSGTTVSLSDATSAKPSFRAPNSSSPTTLRFQLTAAAVPITADYVPKSTEVAFVDISVASAAAPRITVPPVTALGGGVPATIYATVNDNPEARPVYFRWTQVSGTSVTIQTPNLNTISFFTPVVPGAFEDLVFNVQASFDPSFPAGGTATQDAILRVTGTGA